MYEEFFTQRLVSLRISKGVSARDMSLTLGQTPNYINKIENKAYLPSMSMFFNICAYLNITPQEFFDGNNKNPKQIQDIIEVLLKSDEASIRIVADLANTLYKNKN